MVTIAEKRSRGKYSYSSSLALQPLKFGLASPNDRCSFCSLQSSCSPHFHTHIHQVQFDNIRPPSPGSPFFLLPPDLLASNFFTVLSPAIHKTCPSHSNLCALITFKIWHWNLLYISWSIFVPRNYFHMVALISFP